MVINNYCGYIWLLAWLTGYYGYCYRYGHLYGYRHLFKRL